MFCISLWLSMEADSISFLLLFVECRDHQLSKRFLWWSCHLKRSLLVLTGRVSHMLLIWNWRDYWCSAIISSKSGTAGSKVESSALQQMLGGRCGGVPSKACKTLWCRTPHKIPHKGRSRSFWTWEKEASGQWLQILLPLISINER